MPPTPSRVAYPLLLLLLIGGLSILARPAGATEPPPVFHRGAIWLGLSSGYAFSVRSGDTDVARAGYVPIYPRAGISVTDAFGGDAWYRGSIDVVFEPTFLIGIEPRSGFAGGASVGARYNFLAPDPLVPFFEMGGGIVNMELNLEELSDGVGFPLYVGVGCHVFVADRLAITPQWRFHHLSNGGTGGANRGLDDSMFLLGVTFFVR